MSTQDRERQTKALFTQARQGYRPGKTAVWDAALGHFRPGPGSTAHARTAYGQWLEVVAGTRVHTDDQEQRAIIDRMLAAEFRFTPHTVKPITPPGDWETFLGQSLPAKYLALAAQAWQQEATS